MQRQNNKDLQNLIVDYTMVRLSDSNGVEREQDYSMYYLVDDQDFELAEELAKRAISKYYDCIYDKQYETMSVEDFVEESWNKNDINFVRLAYEKSIQNIYY